MTVFRQLDRSLQGVLLLILFVKCLLLLVFSSGYRELLFIPFVDFYLSQGGNPWQGVLDQGLALEFPYPPLMLYILSLFALPGFYWDALPAPLSSLLFNVPTILADLLILQVLLRQFPYQQKLVVLYYFCSPIIFYSAYCHGQLDLIPTALLLLGLHHLVKKRPVRSVLFLSLAMATKLHIVVILPLMVIYWIKRKAYRYSLLASLLPLSIFLVFCLPYLVGDGFWLLVLNNPKQQLIYDSYFTLGEQKVYLPILALAIVYLNLFTYKRIDTDLVYAFSGVLFSIFLLLVSPSPGWFIWVLPFLVIFYLRYFKPLERSWLVGFVNITYIVYFLFLFPYEYQGLMVLNEPITLYLNQPVLTNIGFTLLQGGLIASTWLSYRYAIASNRLYAKSRVLAIGIGGDSSTGKSTLLTDLKALLKEQLLDIEGDGDHRWERGHEKWHEITHLNPKANYLHQQAHHIMTLKSGRPIMRSDYNHLSGQFSPAKAIEPREFLSLCGLHPFYLPKMRKVLDLKIFMDPDESLRQHWKICRDSSERGYDPDSVLLQIQQRKDDSQRYIAPQRQFADLIIRYFPIDTLPTHTDNALENPVIALGLSITLNANLPIEPLIEFLNQQGIAVSWDYSEDLNSQQLILSDNPLGHQTNYTEFAYRHIPHFHNVLDQIQWAPGYRGLIQVVILFMISELLNNDSHSTV